MSNDVIKQAFDNNVNKISCIPETIETIEVYDSRLDEKEIIKPQSAKASYDYYKHIEQVLHVRGLVLQVHIY